MARHAVFRITAHGPDYGFQIHFFTFDISASRLDYTVFILFCVYITMFEFRLFFGMIDFVGNTFRQVRIWITKSTWLI